MNDMCQKSINTLWVIAHDQKSTLFNLTKLSNPSLARLAKSQPNLT
jgi:hypothetical protein